jgi:hypothetical protein
VGAFQNWGGDLYAKYQGVAHNASTRCAGAGVLPVSNLKMGKRLFHEEDTGEVGCDTGLNDYQFMTIVNVLPAFVA